MHPSFTIVIPTYQRREVVCDAVRAAGRLVYSGEIDLIVVVDGSTDGTAEALRRIDLPLRLQILEFANAGAASARNHGAAEAKGEIILFLDDDMMADPDLVEEHARMYRAGADAVVGSISLDPESPRGFLSESTERWLEACEVESPVSPFDVFTGQLSVRRSAFEQLGGFDEAFTAKGSFSSEDSDLGVKLTAAFDVRHNPHAISRQRYVVSLRQFMDRAGAGAAGHLHFARKHPQHRRELLIVNGWSKPLTRFVYRPLSKLPFVPRILAETAVLVGSIALKTHLRSNLAIARFVSGARTVSYWSALRDGGGLPMSQKLLVLGYHAIEDHPEDPVLACYGVSRQEFARQLDSLTSRGFSFIDADALAGHFLKGTSLPPRSVLLTLDDGYVDLLTVSREILQPRGIPAIAFAVTGMQSNTNEWDQPLGARSMQLLDTEQLRELAALGMEIGSHSRTHRPMPQLADCDRRAEAQGSSDDLVASGLPRPRFFAYPYGASDMKTLQSVREAGYLAAFGAQCDEMHAASDPFLLPRVIILAQDRGLRFRLKTQLPSAFNRLESTRERALAGLARLRRRFLGAG